MRWGFLGKFQLELSLEKWKDVWLETRLEWVVGWVCGGSRDVVPWVVSGKEVLDWGVTDPRRPEPRSIWEEGAWPDESLRREVMSSG